MHRCPELHLGAKAYEQLAAAKQAELAERCRRLHEADRADLREDLATVLAEAPPASFDDAGLVAAVQAHQAAVLARLDYHAKRLLVALTGLSAALGGLYVAS